MLHYHSTQAVVDAFAAVNRNLESVNRLSLSVSAPWQAVVAIVLPQLLNVPSIQQPLTAETTPFWTCRCARAFSEGQCRLSESMGMLPASHTGRATLPT